MNAIGATLVWAAVQVTVFTAAGSLAYLIARRRGPAWGSLIAASALGAVLGVTLLAISPWPKWWSLGTGRQQVAARGAGMDARLPDSKTNANSYGGASEEPAVIVARLERKLAEANRQDAIAALSSDLLDDLRSQSSGANVGWRWPAWLAIGFLGFMLFSVVRLGVGLLEVARYRRRSTPVAERELRNLIQKIRAQLNCSMTVEARESSEIASPATIGWRRPAILLPLEWREWTRDELRIVVAHEIAHIARGDYAAWVVAQFGLTLHFYHPLVHWLVARLRVEQELAADSAGARAAGGRALYLETLARMALRADDRELAWAARPFFPGSSAFLRRINMLRQTKELNDRSPTRKVTAALIGGVVLFGILIAGLRGPEGRSVASAADGEAKQKGDQRAQDERSMRHLRRFRHVRQIMLAMHLYADAKGHGNAFPAASMLGPDGKTPHSWRVALLPYLDQKALYDQYALDEPWDSENNLKVLAKMPEVYQSPLISENPNHYGSYFVFTGEKAPFTAEPGKAGPRYGDITDGLSFTVAMVESKREIPWTKPEDIHYEAGKLPEFQSLNGTEVLAGLFDGETQFLVSDGDAETLTRVIQYADGKPVDFAKFH